MTTAPAPTLAPVKPGRRPVRARSLRPWYRNGSLVAGIVIVGALILVAIFAPLITPYSPTTQNLTDVLQGPSGAHWLGTDQFGRENVKPPPILQTTRRAGAAVCGVGWLCCS